jgi:hypothetical protein
MGCYQLRVRGLNNLSLVTQLVSGSQGRKLGLLASFALSKATIKLILGILKNSYDL